MTAQKNEEPPNNIIHLNHFKRPATCSPPTNDPLHDWLQEIRDLSLRIETYLKLKEKQQTSKSR